MYPRYLRAVLTGIAVLAYAFAADAANLGTAFTYQGQLKQNGVPVSAICNMTFRLWDAATFGNQKGTSPLGPFPVDVVNGLFTRQLDFGPNGINGEVRWLEISVLCPDAPLTTLSPRQELKPAPHALALPGLYTQQNLTSPNLIGGYSGNTVTGGVVGATVSGGGASGFVNSVDNDFGTIGGGCNNKASGFTSTIGGGCNNTASGDFSIVGGGLYNIASNYSSAVGAGQFNNASGRGSTVGGGSDNYVGSLCVGGLNNGLRCVSSSDCTGGECPVADYSTVGGGYGNTARSIASTVGGGLRNAGSGLQSTIGGGSDNAASGLISTVGGGITNTAGGRESTIGGGSYNYAGSFCVDGSNNELRCVSDSDCPGGTCPLANGPTIGGGSSNTASRTYSTICGGGYNTASGVFSIVGGGYANTASGTYSTVPGGEFNQAGGDYSFAAGRRAKANHSGAFVWADSTDADFASTGPNQFLVRASGGTTIYSNSALTAGVTLAAGGSAWAAVSDRNLKENFAEVDTRAILDRLAETPITTWNYKSQDDSIRHMGPMGQDFSAAFGIGEEETRITTIDADGVALAAIQGLYEIVQAKDCEIEELEARLARMEALLETLMTKKGDRQ